MDNQFWLKVKFKTKHVWEKIAESEFLGNSILIGMYALCIMFALSLKYKISIWLFLASVGIYFIAEEILSRIDKWFSNFSK